MTQPQKRKQPSTNQPQHSQPSTKQTEAQSQTKKNTPSNSTKDTTTTPIQRPEIKRGWEWYNSVGKPRFVLSPMVGQSELPFRQLLRSHGAQLTYTPMIIANQYISDTKYRSSVFTWDSTDKPLVVQLCATEPKEFVDAAKIIIQTAKPDAIELNLGCPQSCAERGGYGSWMMDKQNTIKEILTLAVNTLPVAITAKIRVFSTMTETLDYVDMLVSTGISLLTVHPRQRHHREEVLADWDIINAIRNRINIPLVLNGDIWGPMDLAMAMCLHPVDGYMCAQGALQMPAVFKTVALFGEYNRPEPQQNLIGQSVKDDSDDDQAVSSKKKKTNNSTKTDDQDLVQLGKNNTSTSTPLPEELVFQSTKTGPMATPKETNYFRVRKYLGTNIPKTPPSVLSITPPESPTKDELNTFISKVYNDIPKDELEKINKILTSYPLTSQQKNQFTSNPMNKKFVSVILYMESHIDQCKRQLQNAVEYIRMIEKYPVFHHSIAQRHLFFILFDLLNKHIDCYDMLYVATTPNEYKDVVHALHRKAAANADFSGCSPDNYFAKTHKERNRRRDGTLAPPPWPVGGGGFNVAMNSAKNKDEKNKIINQANKKAQATVIKPGGKDVIEVAGKKINMSKFD